MREKQRGCVTEDVPRAATQLTPFPCLDSKGWIITKPPTRWKGEKMSGKAQLGVQCGGTHLSPSTLGG